MTSDLLGASVVKPTGHWRTDCPSPNVTALLASPRDSTTAFAIFGSKKPFVWRRARCTSALGRVTASERNGVIELAGVNFFAEARGISLTGSLEMTMATTLIDRWLVIIALSAAVVACGLSMPEEGTGLASGPTGHGLQRSTKAT